MGAKDWLLMYSEGQVGPVLRSNPPLDRVATRELVERLYPAHRVTTIEDRSLALANPDDGIVLAGCFPGLSVVCTVDAALDAPSRLAQPFLDEIKGRTLYLHAMHSVVDWFAYAVWDGDGRLQRSLSLSPDNGVIENVGSPWAFEVPYWAGERPADDEPFDDDEPDDEETYPFPFHPLDLAEDALRHLFGFTYEGDWQDDDPHLDDVVLAGFAVERPRSSGPLGRLFGRGRPSS